MLAGSSGKVAGSFGRVLVRFGRSGGARSSQRECPDPPGPPPGTPPWDPPPGLTLGPLPRFPLGFPPGRFWGDNKGQQGGYAPITTRREIDTKG